MRFVTNLQGRYASIHRFAVRDIYEIGLTAGAGAWQTSGAVWSAETPGGPV